jgi:hypothetical protein
MTTQRKKKTGQKTRADQSVRVPRVSHLPLGQEPIVPAGTATQAGTSSKDDLSTTAREGRVRLSSQEPATASNPEDQPDQKNDEQEAASASGSRPQEETSAASKKDGKKKKKKNKDKDNKD